MHLITSCANGCAHTAPQPDPVLTNCAEEDICALDQICAKLIKFIIWIHHLLARPKKSEIPNVQKSLLWRVEDLYLPLQDLDIFSLPIFCQVAFVPPASSLCSHAMTTPVSKALPPRDVGNCCPVLGCRLKGIPHSHMIKSIQVPISICIFKFRASPRISASNIIGQIW